MFGRYDDKSFKEQLEKNLSWLRQKILNLDDYIPREKFEALQEELEALSREKISLERNCEHLRLELDNVHRERDELRNVIEDLRNELDALNREHEIFQEQCNYYREAYADLDTAYKNYLSLDGNLRYQLAGIFGDAETVQGFLIGAANEKHLNDFWDYLRYSLNDDRLSADDAKILTELFDFCFDALNRSSREPIYSRLKTERGNRFDNRTMTRTSSSRQLGRVQSVLLAGYVDRVGNVIRPSLVFIAD
ncbi:MAG: hypothetical protein IKO74_09295 [Selenomonadaceae bacterium]|nr:hypothetical protein [Selenomonadaceae bacterium]